MTPPRDVEPATFTETENSMADAPPTTPPDTRPLRTAILGYGVSGRYFHGAFLRVDPYYDVTVIATANPERAEQARADHPRATVIDDPRTVVQHATELDLVVVCTPPKTHVELAQLALRAGLDVVVDKPLAPSSAEGAELIAEARALGRRLTVFQNRRYDADFLALQDLLDDGALGSVHTFESRFEWWKPSGERSWKATTTVADGGGILFDLGPHLIDQAMQLFGPVTSFAASLRSVRTGEIPQETDMEPPENVAHLRLTHADGVESQLTMSSLAAIEGPRFHVSGTEGAWRTYGKDPQEAALRAGTSPDAPGFGRESDEQRGELSTGAETSRTAPRTGDYGRFYRELATALPSGGPLPVDPQDSVDVLRLIETAHNLSPDHDH
ncbi:Gfo/Idh/MocA family oxidoreductase [Brachybacterium sp. ACRRE]|uniref:Gfo/Idh/MocA family protein n=1 Tax=Brachybacterium sp. ACRRE TaxID=2918184 RepID=UPI001EF2C4DC|nr:Gfo/Idh/MocA family oxidoreductase [Brachybacterium sp. ACRRE]MCG7310715.1 Gfo/Idh/MocA family oxidoreductase [Brachybacterium sp. ACRRE]